MYFGPKISKKLVNSDYKNNRVEDPTKISSRQEKQVKKYVKDYFDKAVAKKKEHDKKRAERKSNGGPPMGTPTPTFGPGVKKEEVESDGDMAISDDDDDDTEKPKLNLDSATPATPIDTILQTDGLKRKRENSNDQESINHKGGETTLNKRLKSQTPPPPPPPPPPLIDGPSPDAMTLLAEDDDTGLSQDQCLNQHNYGTNKSPDDTGSLRQSPMGNSDNSPDVALLFDKARTVKDDVDISDNAHIPVTPSDSNDHTGLLGTGKHGHFHEIGVHGGV